MMAIILLAKALALVFNVFAVYSSVKLGPRPGEGKEGKEGKEEEEPKREMPLLVLE